MSAPRWHVRDDDCVWDERNAIYWFESQIRNTAGRLGTQDRRRPWSGNVYHCIAWIEL